MLKNKPPPKVSVIMPVFNQAKYLESAIQSILDQTYSNFELLILDDGSNDKSREIIKSFKDKRIKFYSHKQNMGLSKSLNFLINKARGNYIARMDGDDISMPNRLKIQLEFLDRNKKVAIVGSWAKIINDNGQIIGEIKKPSQHFDIRKTILSDNPFIHSSVMFRKEIILALGAYDQRLIYSQDYDLWLRLVIKYKSVNLAKYLLSFRWNPNFKKQQQQHRAALSIRLKSIKEGKFSGLEIYKLLIPILFYLCPTFLKEWYWKIQFNNKNE